MTSPQPDGSQGGQILLEIGKMSAQLAVAVTKLDTVIAAGADHEMRLRALETARAKLYGAAAATGALSGGVATLVYWALSRR